MFDEALAHAKRLDEHFTRTGTTVGPLHGLPISLKDNFNIPGKPSSVGFCGWALDPLKHESTIVGMLRDLGAVAYVKTNVPVAMVCGFVSYTPLLSPFLSFLFFLFFFLSSLSFLKTK